MFLLTLRLLAIPILIGGMVFSFHLFSPSTLTHIVPPVFADDDEGEEDEDEEDEDEEEDRDEDEEESGSSSSTKTKTEIIETVEYQLVQRTVVVTEPTYATDTDGDELVDGMDPDPLVQQEEYFTDTDSDGVPNVLDRHHDSDDFTYIDEAEDANQNGLIDAYEESV